MNDCWKDDMSPAVMWLTAVSMSQMNDAVLSLIVVTVLYEMSPAVMWLTAVSMSQINEVVLSLLVRGLFQK